jgi:hypothetical protein
MSATSSARSHIKADTTLPLVGPDIPSIQGPVRVAWREGRLTRAEELETLCDWDMAQAGAANTTQRNDQVLVKAIQRHLKRPGRRRLRRRWIQTDRRLVLVRRIFRNGPFIGRAQSNLDVAEDQLLNLAPARYILGQMPCLVRHVQCHLPSSDPGRQEFERIARMLGINDPDRPLPQNSDDQDLKDKENTVDAERGKIVTTVRAASSAALRERVRLRNLRNVVVVTTVLMALLAIGVAVTGFLSPTLIPLCFVPEASGEPVVVCPTAQSAPFSTTPASNTQPGTQVEHIDDATKATVSREDLLVVELVGLTAAAVAAAAVIRRIKGSSERYGLPVALAALKLPTGAITAFLGLLLMRGQFVPGLSALDTSAQILAWALVFGYAQQLFTRLVDQQGQNVLNNVRSSESPQSSPSPAQDLRSPDT